MTLTRKNDMGDPLSLSYWVGLLRRDLRRFGFGLPFARTAWRILIRRSNGERCGDCGRGYHLWMANDVLYRRVIGSGGGLWCPACFSRRANAMGLTIMWQPMVWRDGEVWDDDLAVKIGAFR